MMPSGVRNSCDTMDTKLLRNWPSSFSRANVRSSSASARFRSVMSRKKARTCGRGVVHNVLKPLFALA
jgi:hypothetical protein